MKIVLIISIIIIFAVIILTVITTNKAYSYKHKIDTPDKSPYQNNNNNQAEKN